MSYKRKPENITFSVAITPDKKNKLENEDTRSFAVLAPFNPFPKVVFENIKLHCPASREVYLVNPLENTLQVALTKLPDEARGYTWSATEFELAKESQALLVITWTPSEYGSWHDSVKIINKKTKKPLSELKLSSTTEEPPKVHRRCSKSRRAFSKTQNSLSKQENSTKSTLVIKQSENKENVLQQMHLIAKSKELSQSVVCMKNENVTIYESKKSLLQTTVKHEDRQCYRETSETRVSQPLATITSIQDSNPICIAPLTPRRSTYDVTESVVSSRRSTYSLRNKQITSIMEVEKEKREFDLLASPGVHNKSLEVAASKLVDRCVKDRLSCVEEAEPMDGAGPSTTFIIDPSATDSVKAPSNLASLTFNVVEIPPSPVAGPSHELLYDYQPLKCNERFSIDSVASSEIFYDSLEEGQQCRKSLETMLPSGMRWDEFYDFEKFSSETPRVKNGSLKPDHKESAGLSSSSEPLDRNNKVDQPEAPPELVQDTSSNFLSATPYRNITLRRKPSSLSCTISLNTNDGLDGEEILNGSKTLNQTKDTLLQLDEDFGKFNFSIVASSPVYLPSATSKNNLNGTSTPLKSNSVKYSNVEHSPYNNGSYVHQNEYSQNLNDKGTNCCKFYTNRKINNTDLIEPNAEETEKCISVGEFKPYDERKSMSSKEKSPCHETQSENTKSKVPDKTELEEMKHLEQDPLIWNISPPKNNTEEKGTKKQITQCHSSKLAPSKILTKTLRPSRLSNPACKNNFAKVEDNSRTIVGINSAKMPSSSVKNKTPSNPGVSSEDVFLVPSTRVKRGSFAKPSNGSPPKIRKFGDLKIKRLSSTPSMSRKSPFSSMSEARNGSRKECLRSLPRSATLFRKRKSLKVADWVPAARKLKLSSECGSQSEEDISTVAADLDTPDVFVASTTLNPFTEGSCYFSQDWLKEQETELLQWADRMLRPPNELQLDRDQSERGTLHRLNALRAAAFTILTSQPVTDVLRKVKVAVDNNIICIRSDRQLHADLGLQDKIIGLLMSYNPLWLRLCLEAVYQCNIHLKCHSDEAGLRDFIRQYVLDNEYLRKTYSHPTIPYLMMPQFEDKMKKFTVYKFLVLVYLLDLVKIKKVILHDPCLFKKDSRLKSSKEILIDFNKNFVAAAGDITKILRLRGYEVRHQQTYIDEFDFSLTCTKDLRDGVRLTRMVENLVGDNTLCSQLRVPAVSILQKNHNAKVAFTNLKKAGYDLPAEVSPKDISDGHSEKTLSFLWHLRGIFQKRAVMLIIMKWRETKQLREDRKYFLKLRSSAVKIQRWFRKIKKSGSLSKEEEKKGFEARKNFLKLKAVTVQIQRRFRKNKEERILKKKCEAVQVIQNWYKNQKRFLTDRNHFKRSKEAAVTIQRAFRHYRAKKRVAKLVERQDFMAKKAAAIAIQRRFREYRQAKHEREQFTKKRTAAITIQRRYREYCLAKHEREQFTKKKKAAITIQRRYREYCLAKHEREQFTKKKKAAITIQRRYREYWLAKHEREQFTKKKTAAITIQRRYREYRQAKHERKQFIVKKEAAITIQRRFRDYCLAKHEREQFTKKKTAAITIQRRYREYCLAKHEREQFTKKKTAAITIQRRFREYCLAKHEREQFTKKKTAAITIQRRYREYCLAKHEREQFTKKKTAAITIQRRYREYYLAKHEREQFTKKKTAAITIQRRYREYRQANHERKQFIAKKEAAITIQRRFREYCLAKHERQQFIAKKEAAITIQRRFREYRIAKNERQQFIAKKEAAITIQRRFREYRIAKNERQQFNLKKEAAITIQRRFREYRLAKHEREQFTKKKTAAIITIQRRYREYRQAKHERKHFIVKKDATITIQRRFREYCLAKHERKQFIVKKEAAITIQRRFREYRLAKHERQQFTVKREAAITIQRRFREYCLAKHERQQFTVKREAAITIQRRYREYRQAKHERKQFIAKKEAAIIIQRRIREYCLAKHEREQFTVKREAAITIQRRFREYCLAKHERQQFTVKREAAITIQRRYREYRQAKHERKQFIAKKEAAITIQRRFREYCLVKQGRQQSTVNRVAAITIQRRFREYCLAKHERQQFIAKKEAAITIQRRFREYCIAKNERQQFKLKKEAAITIQRKFREYCLAKHERKQFTVKREAAITIQRRFREYCLAKHERQQFIAKKEAAIIIQRRYRAWTAMKQTARFISEESSVARQNSAASRIQAAWRGYLVRKTVKVPQQPKAAPSGVQVATDNHQPILTRGQHYCGILFNSHKCSVAELQNTLFNIDVITVLSADQCQYFVENGAVRILFEILAHQTNRAVCVQTCIELILSILLNFYRAPGAADIAWQETIKANGIFIVFDLMMRFKSEKSPNVFCKACTVVWLLAHDPVKVQVMLKTPKVPQTYQYVVKSLKKPEQGPSSFRRSEHSRLSTRKVAGGAKKKLPALRFNWGQYFDDLRAFDDKNVALDSVVDKLGRFFKV